MDLPIGSFSKEEKFAVLELVRGGAFNLERIEEEPEMESEEEQ